MNVRSTLDELCESVAYGYTASADARVVGPRLLRITDIHEDAVEWQSVPRCEIATGDVAKYKLQAGDIVFARTGATTGKSFMIRDLPDPAVFASYLIRVRPNPDRIDASYLSHFFRTRDYWDQIGRNTTGTAQGGVNASKLRSLSVPVRPLGEQRRIAAILDKADAIRAKRREALAKLDRLLQSVFLDMFGDPATNPKGWKQVDLKSVTSKIGSGATPKGGDSSYVSSGVALVRSMNVYDGEFVWDGLARITESQAAKLSGVVLHEGDVLLNITGASVARVCQVPNDLLPGRVNQHVCIVRPVESLLPTYLEHLLMSNGVKRQLLTIGSAGATRQAITKQQLEQFAIPLPPLERQREFAEVAGKLRDVQRKMEVTRMTEEKLSESVQAEFFGDSA